MKILVLLALVAAACALPTFTTEQLESRARYVERSVTLLDQIKNIALAPTDDDNLQPIDNDARDMQAFISILDLLKNIAVATDGGWQLDSRERDVDELLAILDHLKIWALATAASMEQLDIQGKDKEAYLAVLALMEDIEVYVREEAKNREAFVNVLDWLRKTVLINGGDRTQLDVKDLDTNALLAVYHVLREFEHFAD